MLDSMENIEKLDKSNMLALLTGFAGQITEAVRITDGANIPSGMGDISNIVFSGLGGSAIAGDVVKCCLADELTVPLIVNRDYLIPAFVGPKTLFFASSYSGNTEETISAYKAAKKKNAKIAVITSGGELRKMAESDKYPMIIIPQGISPRAALGFSFVPVLFVLSKIGLIKDKRADIQETIKVIAGLEAALVGPKVASEKNIAKQTASLLSGKFAAIYGWSKNLDCVITRWRNQLNENSKVLAISHFLPEMDHNEIMGYSCPQGLLKDIVVIFLRDKDDHIRVTDRIEITSSVIKDKVHKIIEVKSSGSSLLARICSLIYVGDFVSFYLAILNKEDPTPVDEITYLKKELEKRKNI